MHIQHSSFTETHLCQELIYWFSLSCYSVYYYYGLCFLSMVEFDPKARNKVSQFIVIMNARKVRKKPQNSDSLGENHLILQVVKFTSFPVLFTCRPCITLDQTTLFPYLFSGKMSKCLVIWRENSCKIWFWMDFSSSFIHHIHKLTV